MPNFKTKKLQTVKSNKSVFLKNFKYNIAKINITLQFKQNNLQIKKIIQF